MHERMKHIHDMFNNHTDWTSIHHEKGNERDWLELVHSSVLDEEGDNNHIILCEEQNHRNIMQLYIEDYYYGPVDHYIQRVFDEIMRDAPQYPQHYLGMSNAFHLVTNIHCDPVKHTARYYQFSNL